MSFPRARRPQTLGATARRKRASMERHENSFDRLFEEADELERRTLERAVESLEDSVDRLISSHDPEGGPEPRHTPYTPHRRNFSIAARRLIRAHEIEARERES